jgi:myo-inositol-1(or 4)-monophosphatase
VTSAPTADLKAFLHVLADASAAAILPFYRAPLDVVSKGTASRFDPVTAADRAGEAAVRRLIEQRHPTHGIVGEEYGTVRADSRFVWVIDPIDGTKAFISGQPTWGTLIALLCEGRPILGLNNAPLLGERFWGDGRMSNWRLPSGEVRRLTARPATTLSEASVWVSSSAARDPLIAPAIDELAARVRMLQFGADCYTTAMVAAGLIDIVIGYGNFEVYDIAAHVPILEGAGGVVTALDGGDPLTANAMIASGSAVCHADALAVLAGSR